MPTRPKPSWPRARPTWWRWRAPSSTTRAGCGTRRSASASSSTIRRSTRAPATTRGRARSWSGPLDQVYQRLVGLRAGHAALADDVGRHAGDAVLARLFPVGVDRGLVGSLLDHLARLSLVEPELFRNLNKNFGVADVLAVDEVGAEERVMDGFAAGLRHRPARELLREPAVEGHLALAVGQALGRHARAHLRLH